MTVFIKADGNETKEKPFKTAFVRPDRFRFEYKDSCRTPERSGHIVWCKGKEVQTWRDVQPWTCKVNREGSFLEERADTAAHAICLAALKGVRASLRSTSFNTKAQRSQMKREKVRPKLFQIDFELISSCNFGKRIREDDTHYRLHKREEIT
jgi:hypothetical protein